MLMTWTYLVAACVPIALILLVTPYRRVPGTSIYIAMLALSAVLSFASLMQYVMPELQTKVLWRNISQISVFIYPVLSLFLALAHSGHERLVRIRPIIYASLVPIAAILLIFTNDYHHLMRASVRIGADGMLDIERTALSSMFISYSSASQVLGIAVLFRTWLTAAGTDRRRLLGLIGAVLIPLVSINVRLANPALAQGIIGALVFSTFPACLLIFWSFYRYQVLHVVPIARNKLFEIMKDGIVVLDTRQRVMDHNASASRLIAKAGGTPGGDWRGLLLGQLIPDAGAWSEAHERRIESEVRLRFRRPGSEDIWLEVNVTPLVSGRGDFYGTLSVISDISESKKVEKDLRRRAAIDGLTGLYNRTGFIERAQRHLTLCAENDRPYSLLIMDLDLFKGINDRFGHQNGDLALQTFAEAAQSAVDGNAMFGRIGGEEFAVAVPGAGAKEAEQIAERIRAAVMAAEVHADDGRQIRLTVSIGGASTELKPMNGDNLFQLLYGEADRCLYQAKKDGRNRVVFHPND